MQKDYAFLMWEKLGKLGSKYCIKFQLQMERRQLLTTTLFKPSYQACTDLSSFMGIAWVLWKSLPRPCLMVPPTAFTSGLDLICNQELYSHQHRLRDKLPTISRVDTTMALVADRDVLALFLTAASPIWSLLSKLLLHLLVASPVWYNNITCIASLSLCHPITKFIRRYGSSNHTCSSNSAMFMHKSTRSVAMTIGGSSLMGSAAKHLYSS